jgi:imidazole glycerol phosphate synthase glutamine amidotransferase subunit
MRVVLVPTGTANTASILAAFRRLGADPVLAGDPRDVESAPRVVLPGVGSFGAAALEIDRRGMRDVLHDRIAEGRPTLAVCVGMQLLSRRSEESQGVPGLGVLASVVRRFPDDVRVPQMGWNRIEPGPGSQFVDEGWAYFANSFRIDVVPEGWDGALSEHGGPFVSALEREGVLACQFHPELSGRWGAALLSRWLDQRGAA